MAFDPNKPFTPAAAPATKPAFDPNKAFAPADPSTSAPMAALEGYGNTATLGYLPQLQAGSEMGMEKLAKLFGAGPEAEDDKLRAQGFKVPEHTYVQERDANIARQQQEESEHPIAATAGKAAGIAATSMLPGVSAAKGAGFLARTGAAAANGALQGAAYNPGDEKGVVDPLQAKDRAINAGIGGAFNAAAHVGSEGINKLGDFLMQKAVGMKKYVPGVGNNLADEGVIGTKGMMREQVGSAMTDAGQTMQQATESMPGNYSTDKALQNVQKVASDFQLPSGGVAPESADAYSKAGSAVQDLMNEPGMSAPDMWARAKQNGDLAYKAGQEKNGLAADIAKARQRGFSDTLQEASPEFQGGAQRYAGLAPAGRALKQPESISNVLVKGLLKAGVGGALGAALDGTTGAVGGVLLSTPAGMSASGRTAIGASKLANALRDPALRAILEAKRKREGDK